MSCIREELFEEAVDVARQQVEGGASILDVNMDDALLDGEAEILSANDYEVARARYETAKAQLDSREIQLSYTEIRAPFSGWM